MLFTYPCRIFLIKPQSPLLLIIGFGMASTPCLPGMNWLPVHGSMQSLPVGPP